MSRSAYEAEVYFISLVVFVLIGGLVGALMPTVSALAGCGYGFLVWLMLVVGIPICAHIFD